MTVLFSRSLPLIHYELTDRVRLSTEGCDCGRPFKLLAAIEGRTDDVLRLPGVGGALISVHPVLFHGVLDKLSVAAWQVRQEPDRLRLLVAGGPTPLDPGVVLPALQERLTPAGVLREDGVDPRVSGGSDLSNARVFDRDDAIVLAPFHSMHLRAGWIAAPRFLRIVSTSGDSTRKTHGNCVPRFVAVWWKRNGADEAIAIKLPRHHDGSFRHPRCLLVGTLAGELALSFKQMSNRILPKRASGEQSVLLLDGEANTDGVG